MQEQIQNKEVLHVLLKEIYIQMITELEIIATQVIFSENTTKFLVEDYLSTSHNFGKETNMLYQKNRKLKNSVLCRNISMIKEWFTLFKNDFEQVCRYTKELKERLTRNSFDRLLWLTIYQNIEVADKILEGKYSLFQLKLENFQEFSEYCRCTYQALTPYRCLYCQIGYKRKVLTFQCLFFQKQNVFIKKYKSIFQRIYTQQIDPSYEKLFYTLQNLKQLEQKKHQDMQKNKLLLFAKYDINVQQQNNQKQDLFLLIIKESCLEVFKAFIKKIKDPIQKQQRLNEALFYAVEFKKTRILNYIIKHNVNQNVVNDQGQNVIWYCINKQNFQVKKYLLQYDFNFDIQDKHGMTPLMIMCYQGKTRSVRNILKKRINIDQQNQLGMTALMIVCYLGYYDIAKILLEYNAKVDQKCVLGFSPLMYACIKNSYIKYQHMKQVNEVIQSYFQMLYFGADIEQKDSFKLVKLLIKKGAYVDLKSKKGYTALIIAALSGSPEDVTYLLKKGAFINTCLFNNQITALRKTYEFYTYTQDQIGNSNIDPSFLSDGYRFKDPKNFLKVAEILVKKNIENDNAIDHNIVLMQACKENHIDFVRTMLNGDIDFYYTDSNGNTAFTTACIERNYRIAKYLYRLVPPECLQIRNNENCVAFDYLDGEQIYYIENQTFSDEINSTPQSNNLEVDENESIDPLPFVLYHQYPGNLEQVAQPSPLIQNTDMQIWLSNDSEGSEN